MAQRVKHLPTVQETRVQALGGEYPLEKEMATHSSVLAWRSHGQRAWWAIVHGWQRVRHTEWVTHTQAISVRIFFFNSLILGCTGSSLLWLFSSCRERGLLSSCSAQLLIVVAPHTCASGLVVYGLSSCSSESRFSGCGASASLFHSIWDYLRPGIEPLSPSLTGRFFTAEPQGKP